MALLLLVACGSHPEDWPVCGEEEELTPETYPGYGEAGLSEDVLVCGALPDEGPCPEAHEVDAVALFEENVGPASDHGCGYAFTVDCGPETTRTDACCYLLTWDGDLHCGR